MTEIAMINFLNAPCVRNPYFNRKGEFMKLDVSRREVVRNLFVGTVGTMGLLSRTAKAGLAACGLTPAQGEGPYYPEGSLEKDSDLTSLEVGGKTAQGQVIYLSGVVQDPECRPIAGAMLEIWQACETGKYNHSDDPNDLKLDPDFQYWGRARTDAEGKYLFKSIVPGHYPVGGGNFRPPHIHFKVYAKKHLTLTTQMYFTPSSYDDVELARIVDQLNKLEGVDKRLMVEFKSAGFEAGAKSGTFNVTLRRS